MGLIMRSMRNTERVYKNKSAVEVQRIEREHPGDFSKIRHLMSGEMYRKAFQETGDVEDGVWSAGTVMGLIDSIDTRDQLCKDIIKEAEDVVKERLQGCLV